MSREIKPYTASLEIISGFIRVFEPGKHDPEPYAYSCNLRGIMGNRRSCELFGVQEAPSTDQLRAIKRLLRSYGYEGYHRTYGNGKERVWLLGDPE